MIELAVLVPVLNRPQNVAPLVKSFITSDTPGKLCFIVGDKNRDAENAESHACQIACAENPERVTMFCGWRWTTWPQKINKGVTQWEAEWYLCAADDITFDKGWWDATQSLRELESVGVIGTNDSRGGAGNPRVAAGDHTCHPLIRGRYIRDSGTFDQSGLAVHPGYHHWFVDDELVWTAKLRNAWAYCPTAVIHHNHPYWSPDIPWDETYAAGEANQEADARLWRQRAEMMGLITG